MDFSPGISGALLSTMKLRSRMPALFLHKKMRIILWASSLPVDSLSYQYSTRKHSSKTTFLRCSKISERKLSPNLVEIVLAVAAVKRTSGSRTIQQTYLRLVLETLASLWLMATLTVFNIFFFSSCTASTSYSRATCGLRSAWLSAWQPALICIVRTSACHNPPPSKGKLDSPA